VTHDPKGAADSVIRLLAMYWLSAYPTHAFTAKGITAAVIDTLRRPGSGGDAALLNPDGLDTEDGPSCIATIRVLGPAFDNAVELPDNRTVLEIVGGVMKAKNRFKTEAEVCAACHACDPIAVACSEDCKYWRSEFAPPHEFLKEDFCIENRNKNGDHIGWTFSPTKAAASLSAKMDLVMSKRSSDLWWYDGWIYRDSGADKLADAAYSVAGDLATRQKVGEVMDRLRVKLRLDPVEFNPRSGLLGVKNGVLDCKTGEFRDYRPEDLITDEMPVAFDPAARCPVILRFIESITPDYDDRITLIDIIASGAYRKALHYIAFLTGRGGSGSSTYVQLLQAFYGDESTEAVPLKELLSSRFALGALENSRYSIGSEEEVGKAGTGTVKRLSGGDWISSDVKNKKRTRFRGWTKLLFTTNKIPRFDDDTWAFIRRFVEVKLPYRFLANPDPENPADRLADPLLIEKITTDSELSGLLNLTAFRLPWIIENKQIYRRAGMHEAYKEQVDSVLTFLDRFCTYYPEAGWVRVPISGLYDNFEKWCSLIVGNTVERRQFGRYVKRFCDNISSMDTRVDGVHARVYPGLTFNEATFNSEVGELERKLSGRIKPQQAALGAALKTSTPQPKAALASLNLDIEDIEGNGTEARQLWEAIVRKFGGEHTGRENQNFNEANAALGCGVLVFNAASNAAGNAACSADSGSTKKVNAAGSSDSDSTKDQPNKIELEIEEAEAREREKAEHFSTPKPPLSQVLFLADLPEAFSIGTTSAGPFRRGDLASLPPELAAVLTGRGVARVV